MKRARRDVALVTLSALDALACAVVALSRLAVADEPVIEAEINPLIVAADGVVAVDALVRLG